MIDDDIPKEAMALLLPFRVAGPRRDVNSDDAKVCIKIAREGYERTRNPLYAWKAYLEARSAGITVPKWVLGYLDEAAERLWSLQSKTAHGEKLTSPAAAIAEAFRLKKPGRGGRGTVFREFQENSWIFYGATVHLYMRQDLQKHGRAKLSQAVAEVARINNISKSRVWRALKDYEEQFVVPGSRLYSKK